jgi:hypothetical protein
MAEFATYQSLNNLALWQEMGTITLEEMCSVKLMNRIDTKYVASEAMVMELLRQTAKYGYRAQVHGGVIAARYDTRYFDTESREMYVVHHNRQLTRQKIRTRHYEDGSATYTRHHMYLYKEDFAKFTDGLNEMIEFVKTNKPEYFDSHNEGDKE